MHRASDMKGEPMKQIDADALEEKLDKIPARRIENADGRAYVLIRLSTVLEIIKQMPPAQPEYEPVTAEDFAKTMSVTTAYSFMAWYGTALALMERQGFVICKKTM